MRTNWDRMAASTGLGFAVLIMVAFITYGEPPDLRASASEKAAFFTDDRGEILFALVLASVAVLFFLWFGATLAATLREAGEARLGAVVLGAAAVTAASIFGFMVIVASLASTVAATADNGVTAALYDVSRGSDVLTSFPVSAVILATAIATMRSGVFASWFGSLSLVVALAVASGGTTWATSGFWSVGGSWTTITFLMVVVWTALASILLIRRTAGTTA